MFILRSFLVVLGLAGFLLFSSTQSWADPMPKSSTLSISQTLFCDNLQTKIDNLKSIEDAAETFAEKQSDSSGGGGYNSDICRDAQKFYQEVCNARVNAENYNSHHCGSSNIPAPCSLITNIRPGE